MLCQDFNVFLLFADCGRAGKGQLIVIFFKYIFSDQKNILKIVLYILIVLIVCVMVFILVRKWAYEKED